MRNPGWNQEQVWSASCDVKFNGIDFGPNLQYGKLKFLPAKEKTVERSRLAEARTILAKLQDAKLQAMDNMGCNTFSTSNSACPKIKHLNVAFATPASTSDYSFTTRDFFFSINPGNPANGVCARRLGGDYAGTVFTYMGGSFRYTDQTHVDNASAPVFTCTGYCAAYGLTSTAGRTCN